MTTQTLDALNPSAWSDGKRYLWLLSPAVPVLALIGLCLHEILGWGVFAWSGAILLYGIIPVLDHLVGDDRNNPPESAVAHLENDRYYRAIVYAYVPTQYAVTVFGAWIAASGGLAIWEYVGLVLTVGAINGIGINTAHELGHKKESLDRWLAKLTLAPVAYGHFFVEHNKGHHKNVATPEDPASAKMGESFWAFLPRTMSGSLRSAWDIEKQRLARIGKPVWSLDNENLQAWGMTVLLFGALTAWLGWPALLFLTLQAFYGASLLEVINYIEHYGLLRQKLASGRYERCAPRHSWNSNHIVTNLFLYQLQRHSDHHANPTRRYQALRHFDESPQLPSGYASMLILAYIPWLWFRQMDPLVAKHYDGDLRLANLHPPKREALMRRWQRAPLDDDRPQALPGDPAPAPMSGSGAERYQCTDCGYVYDEALGCPREGFAPGTRWSQIPDDWACPDCAVRDKVDFRRIETAAR
ncbi:fatty acid desaturase [Sinimarinibacterium thermocellulolyticum]|uniref:Fatty acid desaturase n=1 Tax=Sinimarinibacterium thermocellulolyticum TaxID=3170016 RepID=A0ABV2A875_9GAMM